MAEFKTEVQELLPYDRKQYLSLKKWYGVSFQLPGVFEGKDIGLDLYLNAYEDWFKNIINQPDNKHQWIVNHDYTDVIWFPNDDKTLVSLRDLFKNNNIPNTFIGALIFSKDDLLKFTRDLISYPHAVFNQKEILYNDIAISNHKIPFVIKISGHLNIDLLSTDKELLKKIVNSNSSSYFNIKEYKGTQL
ncbi:hypothetical protein [Chryseobacterium sp. OV279]|uniref:hypothetical protein n=1 Tax=Chryseobacterium sp. OV279 TaxID=1500285 RepID=UPI000911C2D9|nr:hypothetical protein [Chryseobacterium sp. OV279]SHG41215.1 hypothetical protein SAMN02787100_4041 [Chryseobacterium sp. OV279]